jgi:hypothetical protein
MNNSKKSPLTSISFLDCAELPNESRYFLKLYALASETDGDFGDWLFNAVNNFFMQSADERKSLDHYMGIASEQRGESYLVTNMKLVLRNRLFFAGALLLKKPNEPNFKEASGLLWDKINGFYKRFTYIQAGCEQPESELEKILVDIYKLNNKSLDKPLISKKYLREILEEISKQCPY